MNFSKENTASTNLVESDLSNSDERHKDLHLSACCDSFKKHWQQIRDILNKYEDDCSQNTGDVKYDDLLTVVNHLNQIITLINLELRSSLLIESCIQFLLAEDLLERLCFWSVKTCRCNNSLRVEQLRLYDILLNINEELLIQRKFLNPLRILLSSFNESCVSVDIEKRLLVLVNQLCFSCSQHPELLAQFFPLACENNEAYEKISNAERRRYGNNIDRFDIFSLLVQFVHRDGMIGEQARDSLLICMSISQNNSAIANYITSRSNICPVLAAGLSGLYSLLPRKLIIDSPDWFRFAADDVYELKELTNFMNSLEFCNAISQICHPSIRTQLTHYIYQAFLVPVMGPGILQDCSGLDSVCRTPLQLSTEEEVIAATAYFELLLRSVTQPGLLLAFVRFILKENFDGQRVIDHLIQRINISTTKLCVMTLSLLETMVDLNCEEIMLELVLRHLIPCTHVMSSQRTRLQYMDPFCQSADKFLSFTVNLSKYNSNYLENEIYNNYYAYVRNARTRIQSCIKGTSAWIFPYDGENPPPTIFSSKYEDQKQMDTDVEHTSIPSADDGSSGYESFKAYKDIDRLMNSEDMGITEDRRTNPPSPCGSEAALEYRIDFSPKTKSMHNFLASSPKKSPTGNTFITTPCIGTFTGPFLNATLQKLEEMLNYDFHVALRLTGLISRLAIYPQPLIHSFLLDHTLVFQPCIKSLIQILGLLKQRIESRLKEERDVTNVIKDASVFLIERLDNLNGAASNKSVPSEPMPSLASPTPQEGFNRSDVKRRSFSISIGSMFKRNNNNNNNAVELMEATGKGYRYVKGNNVELKNAIICAIIFNEWLKELSAIAQEHAILRMP